MKVFKQCIPYYHVHKAQTLSKLVVKVSSLVATEAISKSINLGSNQTPALL